MVTNHQCLLRSKLWYFRLYNNKATREKQQRDCATVLKAKISTPNKTRSSSAPSYTGLWGWKENALTSGSCHEKERVCFSGWVAIELSWVKNNYLSHDGTVKAIGLNWRIQSNNVTEEIAKFWLASLLNWSWSLLMRYTDFETFWS